MANKGAWAWTGLVALIIILSNNILEFLGNIGLKYQQANILLIIVIAFLVVVKNKVIVKLGRLM